MTRPASVPATVRRFGEGGSTESRDAVAAEEPLEIRVADGAAETTVAVTMRTPGNDLELAAGFLFSEGILRSPEDVERIEPAAPRSREEQGNVVRVVVRRGLRPDLARSVRAFYTTSACGVCGKASIEALWGRRPAPLPRETPTFDAATLRSLPESLAAAQSVFRSTGGLHGTALLRADGTIAVLREDVGRHNAVDKVVGERFLAGALPLGDHGILVSGRASFEILQKAVMAGIPFVAAVGAPTSLAVEVAREFGMTLVGFLREGGFNVYAGEHRIARIAAPERGPRAYSR